MKDYEVVVGLEVHAELSTDSKIYCSCKNEFGLEVNTACCPICIGMPGTLPVLNKKVIEYAIKAGHAMNCSINKIVKQDRKNYFYPDLPKGYQISQHDIPLCYNGYLDILVDSSNYRIGITRIHIEEDSGKLIHCDNFNDTLIDFNRAGVPLIEIVSEPDIRSSKQAKAFLEYVRGILVSLGISDGKMQEGSIRCDVNVSVRPKGSDNFGTRCEMKNVNTFSGAVKAIEYESKRQIDLINSGGIVEQQTRRWDDALGESVLLRTKENANDYRYFKEPDINNVIIDSAIIKSLKDSIPELPLQKLIRYISEYNISETDANILLQSLDNSNMFDECVRTYNANPKLVCNWIIGEILSYINEQDISLSDTKLTSKDLAELIAAIESNQISNAAGKLVLSDLLNSDSTVNDIIESRGLGQISDEGELEKIVFDIINKNEKSVNDYRAGKTNALGFLVGQCMKQTKGKGNPNIIKQIILKYL